MSTTKYWTNFIIQIDERSKPWRCSSYDCCLSLEKAMEAVERQRENYRVLSAWIDEENGDSMKTVFHECYLDAVGNVMQKGEKT